MTTTAYLELEDQATGANNNTWGDVADTNMGYIELAIARRLALATTGGTTTLTSAQNRYPIIVVTGALVANATIEVKAQEKNWIVVNNTTGSFSLTVKTPAGTGVTIQQGDGTYVYCDGTNVANAMKFPSLYAQNTWTQNQTVGDGTAASAVVVNGAAGTVRQFLLRTAGVNRWQITANGTAEAGSNAGTNFSLISFDDAGSTLDTVLSAVRSTGTVSVKQLATSTKVGEGTGAGIIIMNGAAGQTRAIDFQSNGVSRGRLGINTTAESGSNAGSNVFLQVFDDAGASLGTIFTVTRSTGAMVYTGGTNGGGITLSGAAATLGFATGAGGASTQVTSRTSTVTINASCGAITLVSAAGTTAWQTFQFTNSFIAARDVVYVCQASGTDLYEIHVTKVSAGSCNISFRTTAGTTVEQPVFNFIVFKAANS